MEYAHGTSLDNRTAVSTIGPAVAVESDCNQGQGQHDSIEPVRRYNTNARPCYPSATPRDSSASAGLSSFPRYDSSPGRVGPTGLERGKQGPLVLEASKQATYTLGQIVSRRRGNPASG